MSPSGKFDKKRDAMGRAKALAKKAKASQVVVYKLDKEVQTTYTSG